MAIFGSMFSPKIKNGTARIVPPAPNNPKIKPTIKPIKIRDMAVIFWKA
jgi:hypothetical protein